MVYKESPIDRLALGNLILRLSREKSLSVRKIASHLEGEGFLWNEKPISKSAVQRWLQEHKHKTDVSPTLRGGLDVEMETTKMFTSCKKIFNAQLEALNKALRSGNGKIDTQALYALLGTAKTLLGQLELYMKKAQGDASGAALQAYINEYNNRTLIIIQNVVKVEIKDEKSRTEFLSKLAEAFAEPPEELRT